MSVTLIVQILYVRVCMCELSAAQFLLTEELMFLIWLCYHIKYVTKSPSYGAS